MNCPYCHQPMPGDDEMPRAARQDAGILRDGEYADGNVRIHDPEPVTHVTRIGVDDNDPGHGERIGRAEIG